MKVIFYDYMEQETKEFENVDKVVVDDERVGVFINGEEVFFDGAYYTWTILND